MSKLQSKESRKTAMDSEISCRSCFYFFLFFNFYHKVGWCKMLVWPVRTGKMDAFQMHCTCKIQIPEIRQHLPLEVFKGI